MSTADAIQAAQALLSIDAPSLVVDGKWGSFTHGVYERASSSRQKQVRAVINALDPGSTPDSMRAVMRAKNVSVVSSFAAVAELIRAEAKRRGYVAPELIVAQASLESGKGRSLLSREHNNYGGLKEGIRPNRASGVVTMPTAEGHGESRHSVKAKFLTFAVPQDWVVTQLDYLERKTKGKVKSVSTPQEYADVLKSFGYYTDSVQNYARGLSATVVV